MDDSFDFSCGVIASRDSTAGRRGRGGGGQIPRIARHGRHLINKVGVHLRTRMTHATVGLRLTFQRSLTSEPLAYTSPKNQAIINRTYEPHEELHGPGTK